MTLKTSFFNLLKHDLKHRLAIFFIAFVVFFFTFPIATSIDANNVKKDYIEITAKLDGETVEKTYCVHHLHLYNSSISNPDKAVQLNKLVEENGIDYLKQNNIVIEKENFNKTIRQINGDSFLYLAGKGNIWICIVAVIGAIITAMSSFSMLMNRRQMDFYYSLPIKREEWFLIRATSDLIFFTVPYFINLVLAMLIMLIFGGLSISSILLSILGWLFATMIYILAYSACCLAGSITGSQLIHFFMINIIFFFAPAVWGLNEIAKQEYFSTHYTYGSSEITFAQDTKFFSPFSSIYVLIAKCQNPGRFGELVFSDFLALFLQVIVFIALSVFLIKIRKSEKAGLAVAFETIKPIIKIVLCCLAGIGGGFIFKEIGGSVWLFIGSILCSLIVYGVTETFYNNDVKKCLAHKKQLCIALALPILILLVFIFDIFGYDKYQPSEKRVESIAIVIPSIEVNSDYRIGYDYYGETRYKLKDMKITEFDQIYDTITKFIEYNKKSYSKIGSSLYDEKYVPDTSLSYDDYDYKSYPDKYDKNHLYEVVIRYNMKSGRTVDRKYYVPLYEFREEIKKLFNNKEYRKAQNIFLYDSNIEKYGLDFNLYSNNGLSSSYSATISESNELISCLREEYPSVPYESFLEDTPLCELTFMVRVNSLKKSSSIPDTRYDNSEIIYEKSEMIFDYEGDDFKFISYNPNGVHSTTFKLYVYPSMKKTIACLEKLSLGNYLEKELPDDIIDWIDYLRIEDYEQYLLNDKNFNLTPQFVGIISEDYDKFGNMKPIEYDIVNKDEIKQILKNSVSYNFSYIIYGFDFNYDNQVRILVRMKNGSPYSLNADRYLRPVK